MLVFTNVNWIAVIVAAIVGLIIGFVWFTPQLLGKQWATATGTQLQSTSQLPPMTIILSVLTGLITAYVLELFVRGVGAASIVDGALVGFMAWLGFIATWTLSGHYVRA